MAFIMAGIAELQSIATMEAMASGLPIIAADARAFARNLCITAKMVFYSHPIARKYWRNGLLPSFPIRTFVPECLMKADE